MEFIEGNPSNYNLSIYIQILGSLIIGKTNLIERIKFYNNYPEYRTLQTKIKSTIAPDFETIHLK